MIRLATPDDASALLTLQQRLDRQTNFMLLEPDERDPHIDLLERRLEAQAGHRSFDLVSYRDAEFEESRSVLAGWLSVEVLPWRRAAHVGYIVLGVDAVHSGRGFGGALLEAGRREAARRGLRRLELTVRVDNLRALELYERHGYQIEGRRRSALLCGSVHVDEYFMAQLLT